MNKNKGFSSILAIVLVLIVLGGGAYWYSQNKAAIPAPADNISSEDEMADRKTYRNDEYGFEFKYPADWTVTDESSSLGQEGKSKRATACAPSGFCLMLSNNLGDYNLHISVNDISKAKSAGYSTELDVISSSIRNF